MPGQRDEVDGTSPGKYSVFQAVGQREQHPDLLPGMCQTSLSDALMHHRQSRPQGRQCPAAGSAPRLAPGIQSHIKGAACDSSRHEPSCSPCLTSLLLSSPSLLSCQHGAAGAAAGLKSETAKGWVLEQAVRNGVPSSPGQANGCKSRGWLYTHFSSPKCRSLPSGTAIIHCRRAQVNRSILFYSILHSLTPFISPP